MTRAVTIGLFLLAGALFFGTVGARVDQWLTERRCAGGHTWQTGEQHFACFQTGFKTKER